MLVGNVYYTYMTTTPTIENNNPDRGRTPAPGPHNPNKGAQTMTTPAPATPENSPFALVVAVSTTAANPVTGRPGATIFSIQNPDGSFWANRRGRRRAWTSKKSAVVARYTETNAARAAKGLARLPLGEFPADESVAPVAPPAAPPEVPYGLDNPASDPLPGMVGKLVDVLDAIDYRIASAVMDVVSIVAGSGEPPAEIKIRTPVPGDRDYRGPYIDAEDVCSAIMIDPRIPPAIAATVSAIVREIAVDPDYLFRRGAIRTDPYDRKNSALFK